MKELKRELKDMRILNKRNISNNLTSKYRELFKKLPPIEEKIMVEYYIKGKSYKLCCLKFSYCERQLRRIIDRSIKELFKES
ncbi:MAG: hypothetical protein IJW82_01135 [Clostridia bacterium]|nr:hypothetical protein [Clostridia bacterium]